MQERKKKSTDRNVIKPQITLVIPCYNAEDTIDRCMESVENQTLGIKLFQIILIDDGSSDDTFSKLLAWQLRYPEQIAVIKHDRNRRQGVARNEGIRFAKGTYVAFLDADDWVEPNCYERMLEVMMVAPCDVIMCRNSQDFDYKYHQSVEERYTGDEDRIIVVDSQEIRGRMIASNTLGTYCVTKLYNRKFIKKYKLHFPEGVIYEDVYWMGLLNCYATRIGIIEERLYHYYMNPLSVSRSRNKEQNKDIMAVNRLLWEEYMIRDLFYQGELGEALQYDMLCTYYLTAVKIMFLRYDEVPYDMFYQVQRDMIDMMPQFYKNKYIDQYTTQFNKLLLGILDKNLTKEEIDWAAESMRTIAKAKDDSRKTL